MSIKSVSLSLSPFPPFPFHVPHLPNHGSKFLGKVDSLAVCDAQITSNDRNSWVMLTQDGKIVPKPGERILHTTRPRVALEITTPASLGLSEPFSLRSDSGTGYITNERASRVECHSPTRPPTLLRTF